MKAFTPILLTLNPATAELYSQVQDGFGTSQKSCCILNIFFYI